MPTLRFDELKVYQLAEQLADRVWAVVRRWDGFAKDTVGKQLVRAADSIGANIAEGCGRGTYRDNKRFVAVARGSLYETRHWLRRRGRKAQSLQRRIDLLAHPLALTLLRRP